MNRKPWQNLHLWDTLMDGEEKSLPLHKEQVPGRKRQSVDLVVDPMLAVEGKEFIEQYETEKGV